MLLSDEDLLNARKDGELLIDPFDPTAVQPSSIDLRLYHQFAAFTGRHPVVDPAVFQEGLTELVTVPHGEYLTLDPGDFVLAATEESVTFGPTLAGRVEGKSSLGRLGLQVHITAGFIDPGFTGRITLEIKNVQPGLPVRLYPGMPIAQLCAVRMSSPVLRTYGHPTLRSRYQRQDGPTPSRAWMNFQVLTQ